mmetsp:Transcript_44951/g.106745  ORF Transcript_44951/g.106745 Transcript_44951/m.106745 type:complete len:410 (+) Transcript_44951:93-1322(+)
MVVWVHAGNDRVCFSQYYRLADGSAVECKCPHAAAPKEDWAVEVQHRWSAKVVIGIVVFCATVSAVPLCSKLVFQGSSGASAVPRFPYPLATAFLQLSFTSCILAMGNVGHHLCSTFCQAESVSSRRSRTQPSWLLGPHLFYKLRHIMPAGLMFGLKFAITNWGLQKVPAPTHLLLQSTDLLWTLIFARVVNREKLNGIELGATLMSSVGAIVISYDASASLDIPCLAIAVNLMTPIALALCVNFLRAGVAELTNPDNQIRGSISSVEFTAWKTGISAVVTLALSFLLESGNFRLSEYSLLHRSSKPPWWMALRDYPQSGILLLLLDSVFLLLFQVNLTWLTSLTSAVTVGIISEVKVIPQWLINSAFGLPVHHTNANLIGAVILLLASAVYACSTMHKVSKCERIECV